jgi:hypothetical protein
MFDAALGHTAVDESGAPVPPALTSPHIESVTIVDAVIGPLSVVVSDTVGSYVYDVRVERDQSDWVVRASRVDG